MDSGTQWATVHGVAESQTRLSMHTRKQASTSGGLTQQTEKRWNVGLWDSMLFHYNCVRPPNNALQDF